MFDTLLSAQKNYINCLEWTSVCLRLSLKRFKIKSIHLFCLTFSRILHLGLIFNSCFFGDQCRIWVSVYRIVNCSIECNRGTYPCFFSFSTHFWQIAHGNGSFLVRKDNRWITYITYFMVWCYYEIDINESFSTPSFEIDYFSNWTLCFKHNLMICMNGNGPG